MDLKEMAVYIVTAMAVVIMFVAMISSAAAIDYKIGKSTLTEPGGAVDNGLEYVLGQQANYSMTFMPTSENCRITSVKDVYPDGTEDLASGSYPILLDMDEAIGWGTTWIVVADGIDNGKIVNYLKIEGYGGGDNYFDAMAPKSSNIVMHDVHSRRGQDPYEGYEVINHHELCSYSCNML